MSAGRERSLAPGRDEYKARNPIRSWIDISSDSEESDVSQDGMDLVIEEVGQYLRGQVNANSIPSPGLPPSPWTPSLGRPRAPTPSRQGSALDSGSDYSQMSPSTAHFPDSPISPSLLPTSQQTPTAAVQDATDDNNDATLHSFTRPPKVPTLPDPAQFPDPYPFHPHHHHLTSTPPALSSAGSSSASTRSSAYTTSSSAALASGDYGHVHVASGGEEDVGASVLNSEDVAHLLARESSATTSRLQKDSQLPWAQTNPRSRSSSLGKNASNGLPERTSPPKLQQQPSYDMGWTQTLEERGESDLVSEEESLYDHDLSGVADDEREEEVEEVEERTAAIVIAEEGRGLIVRGEGAPIAALQVQTGTTHMLLGSSTTPNAMPAFLTQSLPGVSTTLLALDISANFLGALPPALAACEALEELNIASNPLRVLPVFLSNLVSLRVLIADATGISTLPDSFCQLEKLNTLSVRRNKLNSLPSWLCLLHSLQTLLVDNNPFQGPWKALVDPLLAKTPMSPLYPPSTPLLPLPSAALTSSSADGDTDHDDDSSDGPGDRRPLQTTLEEEEDTVMPGRAPAMARAVTDPVILSSDSQSARRPLARTRTTPNRSFHALSRTMDSPSPGESSTIGRASSRQRVEDSGYFGDHEVRRMKSAGELRAVTVHPAAAAPPSAGLLATPARPGLPHYAASSTNVPRPDHSHERIQPKRFASLGVASGSPSRAGSRPGLTQSLWDNISENEDDPNSSPESKRVMPSGLNTSPPQFAGFRDPRRDPVGEGKSSNGKEKGGRWGFLKKMSMGKMRSDAPPSRPGTSQGRNTPLARPAAPQAIQQSNSAPAGFRRTSPTSPKIDMRFSTTGALDAFSGPVAPSLSVSPPVAEKPSQMLQMSSGPSSGGLLSPPSPVGRPAGRRRSFLPLETPMLNIPSPTEFVHPSTAANEADGSDESRQATPSPGPDAEQFLRREEDRAREAYLRALRSVMAYLKDMNDLGVMQNPVSMHGSPSEDSLGSGKRRATVVEQGRTSDASMNSNGVQLRSPESNGGLRAGVNSQALSVATSDSGSGSESRSYKDDKSKRAMVVREIVETERTYVKGLQELMDIYIKPGSAPVNMLSGVGSSKDTVVPASERKVVFSGIEALFSFHKESFLPALEQAAAPVMKSPAALREADADGQLSAMAVNAVAGTFLKHAAFMKMYSSYINNFDNSVQRVKFWASNRPATGTTTPNSGLAPSSSTAQLVGLGLQMSAVSTPGMVADGGHTIGAGNLTTSQRKRIKQYLKRCRVNPRHSQLNLEGYLLLPVQRIPRYKLLLEELLRSTPPAYEYMEDALDKALAEISSLASNMNEGKRESESRRKLVQWQARIRGRFPSPLVQPHRRLIMDGPLLLTRVVRKAVVAFETFNAQGDAATVQVDCLAPELTPRSLIGILCNDLLVLCRDASEGQDASGPVDLWAVLRMQTLPQPASIVHGNALRLVDNKAILYFDAPTPSDALNWYRAINLHIPASKN